MKRSKNSGLTPLYLAKSLGATEAETLLIEQKAKLNFIPKSVAPEQTILSVYYKKYASPPSSVITMSSHHIGLPPSNDLL